MRIIPLLGLTAFLYPVYVFSSYRGILIIFNGVLCHGLKKNKKLPDENYSKTVQIVRTYDVISNMLMTFYTIYICPPTIICAIIGTFAYLTELYIENKNLYSVELNEFLHILGVHIPLCIGLTISLIKG